VVLLSSLRQEVSSRGGQLVVVSIPTKQQVEPADAREEIELSQRLLALSPDDLQSMDSVLAMMHAAADEADVPHVDPTPALIEAAQSTRLYYQRDWHLNPDGHRALAEYVAQEVMRSSPGLR
jgi:hypothetical protein